MLDRDGTLNLLEHLQSLPVRHSLLQSHSQQTVVCYREAGSALDCGTALVLLHGIGSGSANWVYQLDTADSMGAGRVLAWDAPGYADSTPLPSAQPSAADYAQRMWEWLDGLGVKKVRLAGHSLGCIVAASAAHMHSARVDSLVLISPSLGYGALGDDEQRRKTNARISRYQTMASGNTAHLRALELLGPNAHPEHLVLTEHMLKQVHTSGYTQASHMRAHADLMAQLLALRQLRKIPTTVVCGQLDTATPPSECRALAHSVGAHYVQLQGVHHLCALQASTEVNEILGLSSDEA